MCLPCVGRTLDTTTPAIVEGKLQLFLCCSLEIKGIATYYCIKLNKPFCIYNGESLTVQSYVCLLKESLIKFNGPYCQIHGRRIAS